MKIRYSSEKLIIMALLAIVATVIFAIESLIPLPVAVPGVKLGLANAVTLFALFFDTDVSKTRKKIEQSDFDRMLAGDVFMILVCRIVLGALLTGRITALIYSAAGGTLAFIAMYLVRRLVTRRRIWACGAVGAIFHNIGQITAAVLITGTVGIIAYLPVLMIAGIITGIFTGLVAQYAVGRLGK